MLVADTEGDGVGGYGDYPEGAFGKGRKLVPLFPFRVIVLLTDEGLISLFDIGRETTEVPFVRCLGLFHCRPSNRY